VGAGATVGRAVGEAAERLLGASGSLESAKSELALALKQAGKRIVVIIDDLDRLLPSEMRAMFSLVKSLGDLPGVFYVLSYDHIAVSRALKEGPEPIEPEFLEKIVQVPLKLPPPWQPEIRQLFFAKLNSVILDAVPSDESRWRKVFFEAIEPYIRNPRDVTRLANTLQVIWPNVAGDVDLTDLLILTALQLFEPNVYQSIFENIEALAGESMSFEDKKIFAARFEPKTANKPDIAKKALAHLFPKLAEGWDVHIWDGTVYLKKREQRRVCTREYYRNYFLFGRDPDRVSRADIESALEDEKPFERLSALVNRLKDAHSRRGMSRVGALLDQIFEIVFAKPLLTESVLQAILDLSDGLIEREDIVWEFFVTDNYSRLDAILTFGLEPLAVAERSKRVQFMATHQNGLNISALTIEHLAAQHGLHGHQPKHETERLISLDDAEKATTKIIARLREAASTGKILTMSDPSRLIWAWSRLTSPGEVKTWLSKQMTNDDAVVLLAETLPGTSYQSGGDEQKIVRTFKASTYENILDVPKFRQRLKEIATNKSASEATTKIYHDFILAEEAGASSRF